MPVRLTETAINKAIREVSRGTRRDLADAGCSGLRLRLTPAGAATWVRPAGIVRDACGASHSAAIQQGHQWKPAAKPGHFIPV